MKFKKGDLIKFNKLGLSKVKYWIRNYHWAEFKAINANSIGKIAVFDPNSNMSKYHLEFPNGVHVWLSDFKYFEKVNNHPNTNIFK